ncbi:unnamed protein product [Phytophthora fragariaefolia]|uniref:Unnamed protein product n=1 Tax=Phytophthora fragariaefolia TaxID=1490495 RepID=A0A9W6U4W4_9STRA|nr:unnamed protein product [Phytophthora fragariaefolia]
MDATSDAKVAKVKAARVGRLPGNRQVVINGIVELPYRPDSRSDANVIPASALRDLEACGTPVAVINMLLPVYLERVDRDLLAYRTSCDVDVLMGTAAGPVNVANVRCIIVDDDEEEFLLGNPTLVALGIDVGRQMERLAMSGSGVYSEENDGLPDDPETGQDDEADVQELLDRLVANAGDNGFSPEHMPTLRRVVSDYRDVWSIRVRAGEPTRVEPYRLQLKEGSQPVRCKPRRYSPLASAYTSNYVKQLVASGYIYPNNASRWASAVVPVPKADGEEFRIICDYRLINSMTVPIAASEPCSYISAWRFYSHTSSQGAVDSAMHFQSTMQSAFADLINDHLIVDVDDVVLYAGSHEEYLEGLQRFFARLRELNLKLILKKSTIYQDDVSWCEKIIDGQGVTHDPSRVEVLTSLPLPENAAELQHFMCAANWLRDFVVDYGRAVSLLQAKFDDVMKGHSRRNRHAACVAISWSDDEVAAYQTFLQRLGSSAKLSFAEDEAIVCLSTDASDHGWAVILTQESCWKDGVPVHEQSRLCTRAVHLRGLSYNSLLLKRRLTQWCTRCPSWTICYRDRLGFASTRIMRT